MRVAVLYSGGKDSNYALFLAQKHYEIACLINMKSENENSYMFQSAGNEIVDLQAEALELPLIKFETKGEKEKELEDLKNAILEAKKKYKIDGLVTGAIKSVYQASRVQKICFDLNLWCFNPLWQIDEKMFVKELIETKFEVIFIGVFSYPFDKSYLGRKFDNKLLNELGELSAKYKISIAGEGGEFESLVLDGPLFKKMLKIKKSLIEMDSENSGVMKIVEAKLIGK